MGQGQSQSAGAGAPPSAADVKTSYYELLGVERTASDDEIKKAYRLKALQLHPDRNYGDTERATALFAEIQTAYEVLSDKQERAWYDAHEGDILRGGDGGGGGGEDHYEHNMKVTTADDLARMMGKFRGKVDFSDSPNGFYGFVRDTFEQLAREEEHAANFEDVDIPIYPSFGHKDDAYDDVVRDFYNVWLNFSTVKSFAFMDVHRVSDAPDRRYRRAMEKENQKLRQEGIRQFNDAVRTLVAFVRKRDPRYTPFRQSDEEKAKAAREAREKQARRDRERNATSTADAVPEWAKARDPEELEESSEEELEEDHYECVACHKTFKSEKQYEAHEKSKKHQKAVQALRRKMQKENAHLNLDDDVANSGAITPISDDELDVDVAVAGSDADIDGVADDVKDLDLEQPLADDLDDTYSPKDAISKSKKASTASATPSASQGDEDEDEDDEYATRSDLEARLGKPPKVSILDDPADDEDGASTSAPKLGKAAQKRAKKAAKQAAEVSQAAGDNPHKCQVCGAAFPSKSQMFQHIKDLGHAALKTGSGSGAKGKKGKRK
ncbi:DnaJ-domain-containing protein [Corynespora cassiicola Philippines]|uniref:DnaJ-domain-containing protein n=1 Tax=Corynespora cassiicola Philippines TaxID=1448308 RepID=A0A2T2NBG4_CORCC|nr:DnaJ-domain-containing protein [Corynespora cassiicola Philippines]